jgi:hypothetical protein
VAAATSSEGELVAARVEIVERVAAERAHERLGGTGHRVLGVHGFEEQAHGAVLGARALALLLDDRAEHLGILAVEWMAEVTTAGGIDELQIHQVPVLFGGGRRLFDVLPSRIELEIVRVIDTPEATHIRYRVRR